MCASVTIVLSCLILLQIMRNINPGDPNSLITKSVAEKILELSVCEKTSRESYLQNYTAPLAGLLTVAAIAYVYWTTV